MGQVWYLIVSITDLCILPYFYIVLRLLYVSVIVSEYDQEIPQSQTADNPGTARKSRSTITRHQEDKLSNATSSLFPIKMIAILDWT